MNQLTFSDGEPIWCEWTEDGPDKTLRFACNMPAIREVPDRDGQDSTYYCERHQNSPGL